MLVNFSLMVQVQAHNGVITLCNISEVLRTDSSLRIKIEEMIRNIEGVKDIQFGGKV